eukprot:9504052-Pyramimonas_sp.AAC.1
MAGARQQAGRQAALVIGAETLAGLPSRGLEQLTPSEAPGVIVPRTTSTFAGGSLDIFQWRTRRHLPCPGMQQWADTWYVNEPIGCNSPMYSSGPPFGFSIFGYFHSFLLTTQLSIGLGALDDDDDDAELEAAAELEASASTTPGTIESVVLICCSSFFAPFTTSASISYSDSSSDSSSPASSIPGVGSGGVVAGGVGANVFETAVRGRRPVASALAPAANSARSSSDSPRAPSMWPLRGAPQNVS